MARPQMLFLNMSGGDRALRAARLSAGLSFSVIVAFASGTPAAAAGANDVYPIMRVTNSEEEVVATLGKIKNAAANAEYVSAIRGARCLMLEGSYAAAREALVGAAENQRNWEWGYLLEECAAPPWKVNLPLGKDESLHPSAEISAKLMPLVREILEEVASDESNAGGTVMSPDGNFAAIYTGTAGRHGANLCLIEASQQTPKVSLEEEDLQTLDPGELARSYEPRVLFSMYTGAYAGCFRGVRFTSDGSCLVFIAPADSCFTPSRGDDVGQDTKQTRQNPTTAAENKVGENTAGLALFFVPLPATPGASRASGAPEDGATVTRTPWQEQRLGELPDDIRNAVTKIENFDSSTDSLSARFADYHLGPDGQFVGLFNCFEAPHAAEVRELPSGKVIATLGKRCSFASGNETAEIETNNILKDIDVGGAFSADATRVIVSPCALETAKSTNDETASFGSVVAFRVADGTGTTLQIPPSTDDHEGRELCPVWGWSPDSRHAFSSIFDGASIVNTVGVCDVATGRKVEAVPGDLRYVTWSPDASRVYMMKHNSGSMLVADPETFAIGAEIPEATKPSGYPAFTDFPVYASPDRARFTVGRLVFAYEDPDNPLVRLSAVPGRGPLNSWLLESLRNKTAPTRPTVGNEALLYWAREAGAR